ncbi:MAG: DNA-binding protein [Candidatus Omnitrophica bacterium]|nr:DNA-binding protein [Candidatus Omnitrophota bacterium]
MSDHIYKEARLIAGRVGHGEDLLQGIEKICKKNNIMMGKVSAIGAVSQGAFGYYDQVKKKYLKKTLHRKLEMVSCIGNISVKNKKTFVHAHIAFSDKEGKVLGGHLMEGTIVFACEIIIEELKGKLLNRVLDKQTGLGLWKKESIL